MKKVRGVVPCLRDASDSESDSDDDVEWREMSSLGKSRKFDVKTHKEVQDETKAKFAVFRQLLGLMSKNCIVQRRNYLTNCCQISTPIVLLLLILFLQVVVIDQLFGEDTNENQSPTIFAPYTILKEPGDFSDNGSVVFLDTYSPPSIMLYANPNNQAVVGTYNQSGILGNMGNTSVTTYFLNGGDLQEVLAESIEEETPYLFELDMEELADKDAIDELLFDNFFEPPKYPAAFLFNTMDVVDKVFDFSVYFNFSLGGGLGFPGSLGLITRGLSYELTNGAAIIEYLGQSNAPELDNTTSFDLASVLGGFFYLLILHQLFPVFMSTVVYEKEHRLREAMKMKGMKMAIYWVVSYFFFYLVYFILAAFLVICGLILQFRWFSINDFFVYVILFFLWGHVLVAMSMFLSVFFSRSRSSTVVGYFYIIAVALIASNLIRDIVDDVGNSQIELYLVTLFPSFTLYRGLRYLSIEVAQDGPGLKMADIFDSDINMGSIYAYMIVQWVVLLVATYYFDQVWPSEFGVRRHPLFFLGPFKTLYNKIRKRDTDGGDTYDYPKNTPKDVLKESKLAHSNKEPYAMQVRHMMKTYAPKRFPGQKRCMGGIHESNLNFKGCIKKPTEAYHAVNNVSLVLRQGECLGILGPNGAGKTTLISCLTGLYAPSGGSAEIFGMNIRSNINRVHRIMGVCPQHDILWENLTAREHMTFFGRLKNVQRKSLKREIKRLLKSVHLWSVRNKKIRTYSGGMKRRMSVALALLGQPKLVFLDEPSTGLDPKSKRQLWDVILTSKRSSSVILTTHSMEEAEALCDRLIIMAQGRILCVGSSTELKARYGKGFKLSVHSTLDSDGDVHEFVMDFVPEAMLLNNLAGTRDYVLPEGSVKLSEIFATMEENREELGILDWGVTNTSLEEVFHDIVAQEHDRVNKEAKDDYHSDDDDEDGVEISDADSDDDEYVADSESDEPDGKDSSGDGDSESNDGDSSEEDGGESSDSKEDSESNDGDSSEEDSGESSEDGSNGTSDD